jgi:hypothetical protein
MKNQTANMLLLNEKQADTIFLQCWRRILSYFFSLIERISKQQLLSAYHNDDSLPIKPLDCSGELTVRLCAAHVRRHIIAHVSALFKFVVSALLMFRQNNSASCCDFVVHCSSKKIKVTT